MYKTFVYEYGKSTSVLFDLTNKQDTYFTMQLCQLNTKGLNGFARLKKIQIF